MKYIFFSCPVNIVVWWLEIWFKHDFNYTKHMKVHQETTSSQKVSIKKLYKSGEIHENLRPRFPSRSKTPTIYRIWLLLVDWTCSAKARFKVLISLASPSRSIDLSNRWHLRDWLIPKYTCIGFYRIFCCCGFLIQIITNLTPESMTLSLFVP